MVIHTSPASPGCLPEMLQRTTHQRVRFGSDGDLLESGGVWVAPPDRHMLVEGRRLKIVRGARENRSRPAIDPTLRTAARSFGTALTAILLSGMLSDGTYGMGVVQSHGGRTVVQDPDSAAYPDMPRSAVANVHPQHVLPPSGIARLLNEIIHAESTSMQGNPPDDDTPQDALEKGERPTLEHPPAGSPSVFVCPDCGGAMWETNHNDLLRFRCHTGHAFNEDVMSMAQSETVESALWVALRTLEEKAKLSRRLSQRARQAQRPQDARWHEEAVAEADQQATAVYGLLMEMSRPPLPQAEEDHVAEHPP